MNIQQNITLLDGVANDVEGDWVTLERGGLYKFNVNGTFSGATVTLQVECPLSLNPVAITAGTLTAAAYVDVYLPAGVNVRAITSDNGTPDLYAHLAFVSL